MKKLDIIIPVFNEGQKLGSNLKAVWDSILDIPDVTFRIIVVNDGSTDETFSYLSRYCEQNRHVHIVSLTRNFGKEAAILAGLERSHSDAVIVMDSDLQHPPQLIPKMISVWKQGVDVVEACKASRGKESAIRKILTGGFYKLFENFVGKDLKGHSDFKLLDSKVVKAYLALPERKRFFRGLVSWMGFSSARLYFDVPERAYGVSGWPLVKLFRLSIDALTGFTSAPLYLINILGLICFLMSLILGILTLYYKFSGLAVSGFTTVILLILLIGSFIMFGLGLIGIYLGQIFEEVKKRPIFLVDDNKSTHQNED